MYVTKGSGATCSGWGWQGCRKNSEKGKFNRGLLRAWLSCGYLPCLHQHVDGHVHLAVILYHIYQYLPTNNSK